jgi:hypothetical protein
MKRFFLFAAITSGAVAQKKSYGPDAFLKRNPTAKSHSLEGPWRASSDHLKVR